ncbi:thermonuclease [Campylobacter sp. MIT 97-5078]|nr:thermonuclease [Campylobacter sp. MIT 97-5078]
MNKSPKQLLLVLILGVISAYTLSLSQQKAQEHIIQGIVIKIIDGDTIDVLDSSQTKHRIRLYGIDAPEKSQAYGKKAKEFLASLIAGKEVKVISKGKDRYQRSIALILFNDKDINSAMVANGYAHAYTEYSKDYIIQEADAKSFKLGLWADDKVIKPSEFRKKKIKE